MMNCQPSAPNQQPDTVNQTPSGRRSRVNVKKLVAKLRHQLQKRSRHAPPSAGYELPHHPLPAGHAAGITQTTPMMPLNRLAPRLRRSVEGLNLELEEVFVSEKPDDQHDMVTGPLFLSKDAAVALRSRLTVRPFVPLRRHYFLHLHWIPPLLQPCSSSPRPNKTCSFQRQPPEGCERVRVCEEASLLKPLLPSMDLLFRGLSVSPVTGCPGQASPTRHLVERDVGVRGAGSGAVSVTIPGLVDDGMASGKGAGKPASTWDNTKIRFIVCFLGVFVCYFYYGILQETITRGDYGQGDKREKFRFARTLVLIQCVISALFAEILIQFFESSKPDHTKSWLYGLCSLSYLGAMVSSNSALQYVNYPTQVLGKSCKPIPVMILGVTILRKRYPLAKYLCVLLIVGGVAMFLYKPNKSSAVADDHVFGFGEILLLVSLTLDGLTGVAQDHMRARFQTGANHMMLNINLWSSLVLGLAVLWTGEVWEFLSFTERHPSIIYNILLFGLTSALGQTFIFMTVVYFGPLTCSIVTTTRKFFTILGSVLLFGNVMSTMQWVGTILVFLGLGFDAKFGKVPKKTTH
ncbi:Solute carrier family 35 member B1 [Collichthys lucidus]|uniref:Solute carrier family 35 member B1 n=1 Tax=Collichthys lucidus TaxID=240159 RepID=A0A4U5VW72_COLLU|nr:Solute carrier family 35 member B1 [Collichthys lucidus]